MATGIDKRRKVRALEAARDKLLITQTSVKDKLVIVRTQLKEARKK